MCRTRQSLMKGWLMDELRRRILARMPQRSGAWYALQNHADDTATLRIYDDIGMSWWGGVTEEEFARDLEQVTASRIEVQMSSSGGDVFAGIAIYNALRAHPAEVTVRVDSLAASIASVIVQAGDRRVMLSGSQMMVHPAWGAAVGPASDMREFADLLDKQTGIIASIYAERSGRDVDEFAQMLEGPDVWLDAEEAVAAGLADEVVVPERRPTDAGPTLHDELAQTVDAVRAVVESAGRVAALRADAGKTLSQRNLDGLAGLKDVLGELDGLLGGPPADDGSAVVDEIRREHLRMLARSGGG